MNRHPRRLSRPLVITLTPLLLLSVVLVYNTLSLAPPRTPPATLKAPMPNGDYSEVLAEAIRVISSNDGSNDGNEAPFSALHQLLARHFVRTHATLGPETFAGSRLYYWQGSDATLPAGLFAAHGDVVPAGDPALWSHAPFAGAIADGFIHGRGSLDDKSTLVALLAATEELLQEGYRPRRSLYLAFGHDEESGGGRGAVVMAAQLRQREQRLAFVIDEGGAIVDGVVPGVDGPVALIGIAEKGYANLRLTAQGQGGHSSMPPPRTAIADLSSALTRLDLEPLPARLPAATRGMFVHIAPHLGFGKRLLLANLWLTRPLLLRQLQGKPSTAATVRTTGVTTVIRGGDKDNVLPKQASALRNYRLLPGDTPESVLQQVRERAGADVEVELLPGAWAPSDTASTRSDAWRALQDSYALVFPAAITAPYLSVVATDSRHYRDLTPDIYRILPVVLQAEDLKRIHGNDERIAVAALADMVRFYKLLIVRLTGG